MIVAMAAIEREAEKRLRGMFDAVAHPVVVIPAIEVPHDEARRDEVRIVGRRHFIGSQHRADHRIVAAIAVEFANNPIAPSPNLPVTVEHIGGRTPPVPVGISPNIHPVSTVPLAVLRGRQQTIDDPLIGFRRSVFLKCALFF